MKTIIIGGVAGGASAAARLRRLDESAEIVLFERGEYISFANCGLPYYIGGEITKEDDLLLQTPESFHARFQVDVRVRSEVTAINRSDKTVTVRDYVTGKEYNESYDYLILSPGAAPIIPSIQGVLNARTFTLRNVPDTLKIKDFIKTHHPRSAAVIGGGYIGIEMAENLKKAGLDVTIIELSDHLIAPLDFDMACDVHHYLRAQDIHVILNNGLTAVEESATSLTLRLSNGSVPADMVILAVGVCPENDLAQNVKLTLNAKGAIVVNTKMQTSDASIYAVGDAVEVSDFISDSKVMIPLAGPANKQGRIAADNICGQNHIYKGTQGSSVLKIFDMTVATTGLNEKNAQLNKIDYDKVFTFSPSHATYYPGSRSMSIKTLFEKSTGKIIGAQLVGYEGVDKRCDVLACAIRAGMTAYDLTELELCYAPPYSSAKDPVNMIGYVIENVLTKKVSNFHWHDIESLPRDGSITLLDVRTKPEWNAGHIDGFMHIPLDELRSRINELQKSKPVYVNCRSGQRSYIACRILSGHGYTCYNLSGGYRLYESIIKSNNI